jgi:hypothetical protein
MNNKQLVQPNSSTQPPSQIDQNKYLIQSDKDQNKNYEVTLIEDERTGKPYSGHCSCPHHTYRNVMCKHIIRVISYILDN